MNNNKGFTLIELVIVIVILGILAATAAPKFIDLTGDARESVIKGVEGAVNSAADIHFKTLKNKDFTLEFRLPVNTSLGSVKINGKPVNVSKNDRRFIEISRKWAKGDVLSINMDYELKISKESVNENKNWFSINYGPLTLAQQIKDLTEREPFENVETLINNPNKILHLLSPAEKPNYFKIKNTDVTLIPYYMTPNKELGVRTYFKIN